MQLAHQPKDSEILEMSGFGVTACLRPEKEVSHERIYLMGRTSGYKTPLQNTSIPNKIAMTRGSETNKLSRKGLFARHMAGLDPASALCQERAWVTLT